MAAILVIILSALGLVGIAAILIWVSPFGKARTAAGIAIGMAILAGIVYGIQNLEFAIAGSLSFGDVPWWTFPMVNDWELTLIWAAMAIVPLSLSVIFCRAIRKMVK